MEFQEIARRGGHIYEKHEQDIHSSGQIPGKANDVDHEEKDQSWTPVRTGDGSATWPQHYSSQIFTVTFCPSTSSDPVKRNTWLTKLQLGTGKHKRWGKDMKPCIQPLSTLGGNTAVEKLRRREGMTFKLLIITLYWT